MQKARGQALSRQVGIIALPQLVGAWFQILLTPLIGVLFIVQSPYFSLSVVQEYLALEGGPPSFARSFTSSMLLWNTDSNGGSRIRLQDYHFLWFRFPADSAYVPYCNSLSVPATPLSKLGGLGFSAFARRY